MTTRPDIRAAAFDLDGTLVDSLADLAAAANEARRSENLPLLNEELMKSFVGDGVGVLVHRALTGSPEGRAPDEIWQRAFAVFAKHYAENLDRNTYIYPEVETGLQLLKSLGLPLAVITNKREIWATELLRRLGLADLFSLVVGGDTLPERKPSAAPLLHAAEILGVKPENLAMVGDSRNDMIAAQAAGCFSIGVRYGYADMDALSTDPTTRPDWIVDTLPQIYDRLRTAPSSSHGR